MKGTSPSEQLPTEILLIIFEENSPKSHSRAEYRAILALASVCQTWRRVIINTPSFWTYVNLNPTHYERNFDVGDTIYSSRLSIQLQRTRTAPLHISWYLNGTLHPRLLNIIYIMAPLLRWRSLAIYVSSLCVTNSRASGARAINVYPEIPCLSGSFENLQQLSFYGTGEFPLWLADLVEDTALKLRKLEVGTNYTGILRTHLKEASARVKKATKPLPKVGYSATTFKAHVSH